MRIKYSMLKIVLGISLIPCILDAKEQVVPNYEPWLYVDFDVAMLTSKFPESVRITKQVIGIDGDKLLALFRNLYDMNNLSKIQPQKELRIPKYIHQIWLGSPLPEAFKQYIMSWMNYHMENGWHYKLWTDEDMKTMKLYNQHYYDESDSYGVKSDLLKWELVYNFGGVYVDMDFECLKPLDILHYTYDFYTGIQPLDTQFVQLGAALFGAVPGHPILKHCIETIKDDWHLKGAPTKSGPVHFTKSFYAVAGKTGMRDIALPAYYFYPLGCTEKRLKHTEWLEHGAYAVHHWAKSWMPAEFRTKEFKKLNNDHLVKTWNN